MAIFKGAGVAIITPFTEDNQVNYTKLEEMIQWQIEHHTDAIIICGTTGEASTLTHEEHIECIRVAATAAKKRVPVVAGTGSNCTETAVYLSKEAVKNGADGLLIVTPYYNKATQKGLIHHFTTIAQAVSQTPIILYNIPGRTGGCNILPKTAAAMVRNVENIVGMKEATGDISQVAQLLYETQGDIDLYSGNDDQILPLLSLGGKGVISVLSNIAPQYTHDICQKFFDGDVKGSAELQIKAIPLIQALFCEVNPIPIKKAVNLMGFNVGHLRSPLTEIEEEHVEILTEAMKAFGIS